MAIYNVSFTIQDEQGRSTARTWPVDVVDEAALLVTAADFAVKIQAITQSGLIKYDYRRTVQVNNTPGVGSNIDAGWTLSWDTPLTINPVSKIPDPIEAAKDGAGNIDLTQADIAAWVDEFLVDEWRVNANQPTQPTAVIKATLDV